MTDGVIGYEPSDNPAEIQIGDNPKHKMLMAWKVKDEVGDHIIQYHHGSLGFGTSAHNYTMHQGDKFVGTMGLNEKGSIQHIEIHPELRRQGLATKLFNVAKEIHDTVDTIPAPEHSVSRTHSGNAWARAVGGEVPEEHDFVPDEEYRHNRFPSLRDNTIGAVKEHLNEFHSKMVANGLDEDNIKEAETHVRGAHEYLDRANKFGPEHKNYSLNMSIAHDHIDRLGEIHEDNYGDMEDHEKLQEHIGKLY